MNAADAMRGTAALPRGHRWKPTGKSAGLRWRPEPTLSCAIIRTSPRGSRSTGGKLIAHSLGNFAFDLSYTRDLPLHDPPGRLEASGITGYTVTPVYIDDYIPHPGRR